MKIPPNNQDAEQILLSCININPDIIHLVENKISETDFYHVKNGLLFRAMGILKKSKGLFDVGLIEQWLKDNKYPADVMYIIDTLSCHPTSVDWETYADILIDLRQRRELILKCEETSNEAYSNLENALAIITPGIKNITAEKEIELSNDERLVEVYKQIEKNIESDSKTRGILTGFENIDKHMHGLAPQETIYIGARRHTGKTALAIGISENVLDVYNDGIIPFYSVESNFTALTYRRLARQTRYHLTRISTGNIRDTEQGGLVDAFTQIKNRSLYFYDQPRFRYLENIFSHCEVLSLENKLLMVVIDYLQLIKMKQVFKSKHERFGEIADQLNMMAKSLNCPIIILSQYNKENELKESGDIEDSAANVWSLERKDKTTNVIDIVCTKGKEVGTWSEQLIFETHFMQYKDGDF